MENPSGNQSLEGKTRLHDKRETNLPPPFPEPIENHSVVGMEHASSANNFFPSTAENECGVVEEDESAKQDDEKGNEPDHQLTPFLQFIESIEGDSGIEALENSLLNTENAPCIAHFSEDAMENQKEENMHSTTEAKRFADPCPESRKKQRVQEQVVDREMSRSSGPCFLCKQPVEDLGLRLKTFKAPPVVLTLSCNHLVHTVCMSYLYYVRRPVKCPICGTEVSLYSASGFHMSNYVRRSNMVQTKLLEFMETDTFRNEENLELINWLFKKVNGQVNIYFEKEKEACKWPVLKSNEFVHEALKQSSEQSTVYKNWFLRDLAKFCVLKHECDVWCPEKCWYRDVNKMSKPKREQKVRMELKKLIEKNGDADYGMSTEYEDDSDYEEYNGPGSFPCLVPWFPE